MRAQTPNYGSLTVDVLIKRIELKTIIINPDYQRKIVWAKDKQSELINSLYLGYLIPSIVLGQPPDSSAPLVCIDGQQRIASLLRFVRSEIPLILDDLHIYYLSMPPRTKHARMGHEHIRHARTFTEAERLEFITITIGVITVYNMTDQRQRETFERLQNGVPLMEGETLYCRGEPAFKLCKAILVDNAWIENYTCNKGREDFVYVLRALAIVLGYNMEISKKFKKLMMHLSADSLPREKLCEILKTVKVIADQNGRFGVTNLIVVTIICNALYGKPIETIVAAVDKITATLKQTPETAHNTMAYCREADMLVRALC